MKVENGQYVQVHYKGTLSDGTEFDNSRNRKQPLSFKVGSGRMISGFSDAVVGMTEGQVKTVTLKPVDAYGERNPKALQSVPKKAFGPDFEFEVGAAVQGNGPRGPFLAKIFALEEEKVVLDLNHPLAGEELNFEIELVTANAAPPRAPAPGPPVPTKESSQAPKPKAPAKKKARAKKKATMAKSDTDSTKE
jgi:FKBP-type peptidyl-prolyl cis-trans isomerase 2